jgi:hypothetical protein
MNNLFDTRRRCRLAIKTGIFACLIAAVLTVTPARAETERNLTLDYVVYIGGLETIRFSFDTQLRATGYKIKMALEGQGVLDWWFSWSVRAFSEGRLADGAVVPIRSGADSSWNGKRRHTRLRYMGSKAPTVVIKPPADDDDRDVVPPELRSGPRVCRSWIDCWTKAGRARRGKRSSTVAGAIIWCLTISARMSSSATIIRRSRARRCAARLK